MHIKTIFFLAVIIIQFASPTIGRGQTVGNDSGCDICHGGIVFSPDEASALLGTEGAKKISIIQRKTLKNRYYDLDGIFQPTATDTKNPAYDVKVSGTQTIFIRDLKDGSTIVIQADSPNLPTNNDLKSWNPQIYFFASKDNEIDLKDPLNKAWEKAKESHLFFMFSGDKKGEVKENVVKEIIQKCLTVYVNQ